MKKFLFLFAVVAAAAFAVSCEKEGEHQDGPQTVENVFEGAVPTGYFGYAEVSVPAGTETVYIEYTYKDGSTKTIAQAVTPEVAKPEGGKDIEPFGTVKLLFEAEKASKVSVYYNLNEATKAEGDESIYTLQDFPVDQIESGEFGKTRYVQVKWSFSWENSPATGNQNTRTYPKDVVFYDAEHNHTLRYTFAYGGGSWLAPEGYVLTDAYEVVDHVVVAYKYNYCGGCGNCPKCMPWGCDCGCSKIDGVPVFKENPDFKASGNTTGSAGNDATVVDPETPGTTPTVDGTGKVIVYPDGSIIVDYAPADITTVQLPEPASYKTQDGEFTMYHSSGVVMFDDSWPNLPATLGGTGNYDFDFNDVVVDYDIEAVTVDNSRLADEGWREQVKVVLHLRALGGQDAWRVGMALENFNTDYVESIEDHKTLDSWQNSHGNLPAWAQTVAFQENCIHYDAVSGSTFSGSTTRPSIEIGQLQAFNGKKTYGCDGAGKDEYTYINGSLSTVHVMNPGLKLWDAWKTPKEEQYDDVMAAVTNPSLAQIQNLGFYNTIPGFVNQAGGLYTYTVIYHMKARAEMTPEESQQCLANMVDAVVNTTAQNFFIVKQDWTPIGLKGYTPLDYKTKDNHNYTDEYNKKVQGKEYLTTTPYVSTTGQVWAFKCPVLTRHAWEKQLFSKAYPLYEGWVTSGGTQNANWYKLENANVSYLSCEW